MKAHTKLNFFKRHVAACEVLKRRRMTSAKAKLTMDCGCPIWIMGRTPYGDEVARQTTGTSDMAEAERIAKELIKVSAERHGDTASAAAGDLALSDCITRYLASRDDIGDRTLSQHKLLLGTLENFMKRRGVLNIRELSVDNLEDFKTDGLIKADGVTPLKSTSKGTSLAKLQCFLKESYRRGWLTEHLADKMLKHKSVYEQKEPYTSDEVKLILDGALKMNGGTHGFAGHPKTFRLLLLLMLETGMRVGDAVRFDPATVTMGQDLFVYKFFPKKQKKVDQPKLAEVYLRPHLKQAIDDAKWLSPKRPFYYGDSTNTAYVGNQVYERMQSLGEKIGVKDCRPHRLRDTFAVRMLEAGMPLEDVSRLLCHSSVKVTETFYAKWITSRKNRLEGMVAQAFQEPLYRALGDEA